MKKPVSLTGLYDPITIDELVRLTDERLYQLPPKYHDRWLREWSNVLFEYFYINLPEEMRKRGYPIL